jgi:hypothetical protein
MRNIEDQYRLSGYRRVKARHFGFCIMAR